MIQDNEITNIFKDKKIIITGGVGFIGSNLVKRLNDLGIVNIIIVDHIDGNQVQLRRSKGLKVLDYYDRLDFLSLITSPGQFPYPIKDIEAVVHLGAHTSTVSKDKKLFKEFNTRYSQKLFNFCLKNNLKFIYASSASVYGSGAKGFSEDSLNLKPLNLYAHSKYLFDQWVLNCPSKPKGWVGLRFFNVYGPNEEHKGPMASYVFQGYNQILKTGKIKLFKSYKRDFADGEQKRDFVYIKDIIEVLLFFLKNKSISGIFNVGTGKARTFLDLSKLIFKNLKLKPNIIYFDMPKNIRKNYQYFTEANISKLKKTGYKLKFYSLEEGIKDYIKTRGKDNLQKSNL